MELDVLITGGIGLITSIASAWTSWFFARKKYNTEVDSNYIENLQKALATYDSIIAHNKTEIEHLMKRNDKLDLAMNICMDFSCKARQRDLHKAKTKTTKE